MANFGQLSSTDSWIQFFKFASLTIGAISGILAAVTETKDKESGKINRAGKVIFICLVTSIIVNFAAQGFDLRQALEKAKKEASEAQNLAKEKEHNVQEERNKRKTETARFQTLVSNLNEAQKTVKENLLSTQVALNASRKIAEETRSLRNASETQSKVMNGLTRMASRTTHDLVEVAKQMEDSQLVSWKIQRPFGKWISNMTFSFKYSELSLRQRKYVDKLVQERRIQHPEDFQSHGIMTLASEKILTNDFYHEFSIYASLVVLSSDSLDIQKKSININWTAKTPRFSLSITPRQWNLVANLDEKGQVETLLVGQPDCLVEVGHSTGEILNWVDMYDCYALLVFSSELVTGNLEHITLGYGDTAEPKFFGNFTTENYNRVTINFPGMSKVKEVCFLQYLDPSILGYAPESYPGRLPLGYKFSDRFIKTSNPGR